MGILRGNRQSDGGECVPARTGIQMQVRDLDDETLGRCEAQAIISRAVVADPYAAWLERREAERRLREPSQVRWVYRYPRPAGTFGGRGRGGTREVPARPAPGSPEDGLVGVA